MLTKLVKVCRSPVFVSTRGVLLKSVEVLIIKTLSRPVTHATYFVNTAFGSVTVLTSDVGMGFCIYFFCNYGSSLQFKPVKLAVDGND